MSSNKCFFFKKAYVSDSEIVCICVHKTGFRECSSVWIPKTDKIYFGGILGNKKRHMDINFLLW